MQGRFALVGFIQGETMKLLLRRDQKSGMLSSSITFTLDCRAEISESEKQQIKKYKMGKTLLYSTSELVDPGSGLLGVASRFTHRLKNLQLTIDDLVTGAHIECKDISEMCGVEEQIKQACQTFKLILETSAHFGGEEVIEI